MVKGKAIDIIRTFSRKEIDEFGKFVRSPFFNSNTKLSELFMLLKKYHPAFSHKSFTKEIIYKKLYPGKKYNDGTMRKLLSSLQTLAENFLSHDALAKSYTFYKDFFLLNSLDGKKLDKIYRMHLVELDKIYKQKRNFEDDYFFNNFELEVSKLNFNLGKGRGGFDQKENLDNLLNCSIYIICYSLIVALKLNQDLFARGVGYDFDYENTITNKFIESIGISGFLEQIKIFAPDFYPVVLIYYYNSQIASGKDNDDKIYFEMKKLIKENIGYFTRFEQYNLLLFLENSCDLKMRIGKEFQEELFEVHNLMLSKELFTSEQADFFPLIGFRKIVRNALLLSKFDWTISFIDSYIHRLPAEFVENMKFYTQALLNYYLGKFDIALREISKVKFEVYSIRFDSWILKLQIDYELKYFEEAIYSVDSYKHSIKSDTSSPQWAKERFSKFLNLYQRLIKALNADKIELEKLKDDIGKSTDLITEKGWLLEKANLLV